MAQHRPVWLTHACQPGYAPGGGQPGHDEQPAPVLVIWVRAGVLQAALVGDLNPQPPARVTAGPDGKRPARQLGIAEPARLPHLAGLTREDPVPAHRPWDRLPQAGINGHRQVCDVHGIRCD
jgi:hypothetical protein